MLHWESPQTVFSTVSCSQTCIWRTMMTKSQWMGQSILMVWNHKTHLLASFKRQATHIEGVWSHSLLRMTLLHYSLTKQTVVSSHLVRMSVVYWTFKEHSKLLFHFISKVAFFGMNIFKNKTLPGSMVEYYYECHIVNFFWFLEAFCSRVQVVQGEQL